MRSKKSVLLSAVSLALAGVMCVGLAACGDNGESGKLETPSETVQSFVSEKIDEATWNGIFVKGYSDLSDVELMNNFNNVKMELELTYSDETEAYAFVNEMKATFVLKDLKEHVKATVKTTVTGELPEDEYTEPVWEGEAEYEYYLSYSYSEGWEILQVDECRVIQQEDGKCVLEYFDMLFDDIIPFGYLLSRVFGSLGFILTDFIYEFASMGYSEFKYSEDDKGYKKTESYENKIYASYIFKFQNSKLKTFQYEDTQDTKLQMYCVFTYGGQSVSLPEVSE